ncbi:MAG: DUF4386 domain-containing protein [Acidobacteria bacterium]|nr:DUF4386 domain-containing protein [Acidobacteriota bacterium]
MLLSIHIAAGELEIGPERSLTLTNRNTGLSPLVLARIAGFLYLIVIVGGAFAELIVRQRLIVTQDAAATAQKILANEQLFRWGFVAELVPLLCNMLLAVIFYELFAIVNRRIATLVVYCSLVGSAIEGADLVNHMAPLILLKRGEKLGIDMSLLQAQAYMTLNLQSIGFAVALVFFGIACLALGYLIYQSRFLPRFIGAFLAVEGFCYLINSFVLFLAPAYAARVFQALMVAALAEIVLCLWLLIRGVNASKWDERAASEASHGDEALSPVLRRGNVVANS